MKIFYTAYEGGYIFQKTLPFGIGFKRLMKRLESLPDFPVDWKCIFGTRMHSVFVPTKAKYYRGFYQRWDAINGWNQEPPSNSLADLKRYAKDNKKQKGRKTK